MALPVNHLVTVRCFIDVSFPENTYSISFIEGGVGEHFDHPQHFLVGQA